MSIVSVILPSYNHGSYIDKAIESVLEQSYEDFELLISDDCSTDNTIDIINKYTDKRIKVNIFEENKGATINTNYLISKSTGKYIALINSDDVWLPNKLEKEVEFLEKNYDYGACFTWASFIDENNNIIMKNVDIFRQPNRTQGNWLSHLFQNGNCICHPSILIRKEVYDKAGTYNLAMRQLPDLDMWIRVLKEYKIHIIPESLVLHRRFIKDGENTSSPSVNNSIRDVMESYYILTNYFENIPDEIFREGFSDLFRNTKAYSTEELICEKFFLMMDNRYYMPKIGLMASINYMIKNYNQPGVSEILKKSYEFDLKDFYTLSCKVDLLNILPDGINLSSGENIDVEKFVKSNKLKVISLLILNKNSKIYKILSKIYLKMNK